MRSKKIQQFGFTFIEVLLVIGLLGLIVALAIPFYQSFQVTSELDNAYHELIGVLRQTQLRAMASENFRPWGVHLEKDSYTVFSGETYTPDDKQNQRTDMPRVLQIESKNADILFDPVRGTTSTIGSITLSSANSGQRTITINAFGTINAE